MLNVILNISLIGGQNLPDCKMLWQTASQVHGLYFQPAYNRSKVNLHHKNPFPQIVKPIFDRQVTSWEQRQKMTIMISQDTSLFLFKYSTSFEYYITFISVLTSTLNCSFLNMYILYEFIGDNFHNRYILTTLLYNSNTDSLYRHSLKQMSLLILLLNRSHPV